LGWARRECIAELLGPTREALEELQEIEYERRFKKRPGGTVKSRSYYCYYCFP
jgi:hypothetical protein